MRVIGTVRGRDYADSPVAGVAVAPEGVVGASESCAWAGVSVAKSIPATNPPSLVKRVLSNRLLPLETTVSNSPRARTW